MSDAVIVAIIAGLCSVIGQCLISHQANEKRQNLQMACDLEGVTGVMA